MKVCTKCGIEKEESEYHKDKIGKGGLSPHCKVCRNNKNRIYYAKTSVIQIEKSIERVKNNRERYRLYQRRYYYRNRDKINKENSAKRKNNGEAERAYKMKLYNKWRDELNDNYIKPLLKAKGFTKDHIANNPELIELQKIIIKTKRLCQSQTSKNLEKV